MSEFFHFLKRKAKLKNGEREEASQERALHGGSNGCVFIIAENSHKIKTLNVC